ncbi:helix-turn-helix domain-containing protein [Streptomyces litchfieldiae]|uniref:Helix-turn-helix domain-containing protein n=1 Tax=Streptomyces litchfieldiae TaxID=3075543 RepID=A0ABU2MWF4_9ACTN|nr:helix-turn-helix domain-containing protein [Streptomyces sp. DSM 44938]MDT0345173.1 helix-turn-helix domain-containing protein [Streptomyces sp. DSM 44938]
MLEAAGLTTDEEAVYRELVTVDSATPGDLARRTGLTPGYAERLLAGLERKGLVNRASRTPPAWAASPPDVALLPQLQQRAEALEQARAAVTDLLETYRGTRRRHDAGQLIEVVTGAAALRQRLRQIQDSARHELLWFCKAQYVAMPSVSNTAEFAALARGVRYRVLYERAFFEDPGSVDSLVAGVRAGENARAVPQLPLRMAIVDRELAVCPLVPGGPNGSPEEPTAALLRDSSLLQALLALFERYWEDGVPLAVSASGAVTGTEGVAGTALSEDDQHLLSLLVAGVADKAIASQLQLSLRTVQRRIQHLMTLTGAATRMQLAWLAARKGLI